jgi:hypothetical protein
MDYEKCFGKFHGAGCVRMKGAMKEQNITAPKKDFDALLDKLLKSQPLPKKAIPPKRTQADHRERPQSSEQTGREK